MSTEALQVATTPDRSHSGALWVLGLALLMIAINSTLINVALPSLASDLKLRETLLAWVVNAYLMGYGGFLLLGGRLGDVFGHRRLLLLGITCFTLASLGSALTSFAQALIALRVAQGIGGAVVATAALSLVLNLVPDARRRVRALGFCAFVSASGGSLGVLLGGTLVHLAGWRWVFLLDVLIGSSACALCFARLPRDGSTQKMGILDFANAAMATTSLVLVAYAMVNGNRTGWGSAPTLIVLAGAGALLIFVIKVANRTRTPLVPLRLLRQRNVLVANAVAALLATAVLTWNVVFALYLQHVLRFTAIEVGVTFLPANVVIALISLLVTPVLVVNFGIRSLLVVGLLLVAGGLMFLGQIPVGVRSIAGLLPGMLLVGIGVGLAYNPLLLGAVGDVQQADSGAVTGIFNTSFTMGGAIGFAALFSVPDQHVGFVLGGRYQHALCSAGGVAMIAALICALGLGSTRTRLKEQR